MMKKLVFIFFFFIIISNVFSQSNKANIYSYLKNGKVYLECYLNDGSKYSNSKITVMNNSGKILVEGKTDSDGKFSFVPIDKSSLIIQINTKSGKTIEHPISVKELQYSAEDKIDMAIEKNKIYSSLYNEDTSSADENNPGNINKLINKTIDKKIKPVIELCAKIDKKLSTPSLFEIIGYLGYPAGLIGIYYFYFKKKRRKRRKSTES